MVFSSADRARVTVRTNLERLVVAKETVIARVGEGIVNTVSVRRTRKV
ncbi:MAG: flotillin-like FloA family protein [Planctomycetota bacterium]